MLSPFDLLLGQIPDLAPVFREQYLRESAGYEVVLEGRMELVWNRPGWLRPFFALLAMSDLVFPEVGKNIPVKVTISSEGVADGSISQVWKRQFKFEKKERRFVARVSYDEASGQIFEGFGPGRSIHTVWRIRFSAPDILEIRTGKCWLKVGPWSLTLPRLLGVEVTAIERAGDPQTETIQIELSSVNPILGPVFGYRGAFAVRRVYH
jgi:uncharacterized protein DUF4166